MIKIAHINFAPQKSVIKTLEARAAAAKALALNIDFYIIHSELSNININNCYYRKEKQYRALKAIHPFAHSLIRLLFLTRYVNLDSYDVLVLRYPKLPVVLPNFLKRYGKSLITEHHSFPGKEIRSRPSAVRQLIAYFEDILRPKFLRRTAGLVGVTEEITSIIAREANLRSSLTISNGISVEDIPFTGMNQNAEGKVNALFVSSEFVPWHGLDRLLVGAELYTGQVAFNLILMGKVDDESKKQIIKINRMNNYVTIELAGPLYGEEKEHIFQKATIAIGSLALFRKGLTEASPLKVREYLARGIPFIYAYIDSDLSGDEDFALQLPVNSSPIDIQSVIQFALEKSMDSTVSSSMRKFAIEKLDWKRKTMELYDYCTFIHEHKEN